VQVDPVVILADELDAAYAVLAQARDCRDWGQTRRHLADIAALHARLRETESRTVIGAAHQLRAAAGLLPRAHAASHGDRLREIAARFDDGVRQFSDLVWLRGALQTLAGGACGRPGENAATLIALALKGASRPVLLYRAALPPPPQHHGLPARSETRH
jgi:hypothetical protein